MMRLEVKDLHAEVDGKEVLSGVSFVIDSGEVVALMGPNGSGKSSLANVLAGNPRYKVVSGVIFLDGEDVTNLGVSERARRGLFMGFQHPVEVSGVSVRSFLRTAVNSKLSSEEGRKIKLKEFRELLEEKCNLLNISVDFLGRYLNEGFSGGEKKKAEVLQMLVLNPDIAVLDETDSGLDVDALKIVSKGINKFLSDNNEGDKKKSVLIITHYKRILEHVKPNKVLVMVDGGVVREGGGELVEELERKGYGGLD